MSITASQVKELRERTGAGMMECKKALVEAQGDIDLAVENMRKAGAAKADKKAGRTAAEGTVLIEVSTDGKSAVIVEINCETDFVGRDTNFLDFSAQVAKRALEEKTDDVAKLIALPYNVGEAKTIEEARQNLVTTIGENIQIRRIQLLQADGIVSSYSHGGRIGVLVALNTDSDQLGKDLAMHVAALKPVTVTPDDISKDLIDKEREIFTAQTQAESSGKPADIIEKIVDGRMKKFVNEISLIGQAFVKDPSTTVGALLKSSNAEVTSFVRFEVGEGIEKEVTDFAKEVMDQVKGSN